MSGMLWLSGEDVQVLGWMLLHFVWQGLVVAILLAGMRQFFKDPRLSYATACAALLAMVFLPLFTLLTSDSGTPSGPGALGMSDVVPVAEVSQSPTVLVPERVLSYTAADTPGSWIASLTAKLQEFIPVIVLCWAAGVLLLSLRLVGGCWTTYRLQRAGTSPLPDEWQVRVRDLVKRQGIRRSVKVVTSLIAAVPMVVGVFRPVVLVPVATLLGLTHQQLEAVLIHELAHVRRYDNLVNLLQRLVETVFFFHPAIWWVSNCIRVEREHCCDDAAIAGSDPRLYAETLTTLEELRSPILAAAATGGPLLSRVRRLLSLDGSSARGMSGFTSGLLTILVIMAIGAATLHATLSANQIEEKEMASELKNEPSRKVLDTKRTEVWTRIITALHDMLQTAGETEWSVPRLQGVMGNGFSFEMRKGGGAVWQEGNLDWWLVFESRFEEDLGCRIQRFQAREDTDEAESKRVMTEAWDAVRASIDRGVPVAAWAPMYEGDEPNEARDWGLLVGYDEAQESYVVRRRRSEFDYRYDEIGENGLFLVLVYQGPEPGDHSGIHIKALRNAVALANGTRYDADKAPIKVDARGIAAFDLWLDAMKSGAEPDPEQRSPRSEGSVNDSREHAGWLASNRRYVAVYLRELVEVFPAAADLLTEAAGHYDRVAEMAGRLHTLCDDASKSGGFTPETRIQASSVLAGAMDNEMAALRHMEKALRRIDPQFEPTALREEIGTEAPGSRPSGGKRVELDISPEENYGGSILSVLPPALQAAGRDWSTEFIRGYLGLGFVFSMYEGGGRIWHRENYEWSYFWGTLPDVRAISAHLSGDIGPHKEPVTPEEHAQTKVEAWDAVRVSIDAGIPAIVMDAMNKEMEESGKKPYMWSLIVGYDEAAGTYIGHHNHLGKFTIGWDDFGHVGSAQWFCVMVVEPGSKPFDDLKAHRRVIRRAIEASQGKRPANFEDATAYGLAAWEMWLDGFRKETIDVSAIKYHTSFLETSRNSAAVRISEQSYHPFRSKVTTDFGAKLPPVSV